MDESQRNPKEITAELREGEAIHRLETTTTLFFCVYILNSENFRKSTDLLISLSSTTYDGGSFPQGWGGGAGTAAVPTSLRFLTRMMVYFAAVLVVMCTSLRASQLGSINGRILCAKQGSSNMRPLGYEYGGATVTK